MFAAFFLYAFAMGGFYPRLAEIQRGLGVAEGALGLALIGVASGTMVSLALGPRVLPRFGHRAVLRVLLPLLALLYALAALAPGPLALYGLLFPAGLAIGAIEIVVNLEADRLEHQSGQRLMNRAHAFWSFGFFGAGLLAAALAQLGLPPQAHLGLCVPLVALATALALRGFAPAPARPVDKAAVPARGHAVASRPIVVLVLFTLAAMVLEGGAADWAAIYMRDVFAAAPFAVGFAVAVGALAQACVRYVADGFVERFGALAVARALLVVLGLGNALVVWGHSVALSLLGFALMGAGTSVVFPMAMSAAAQRGDRPAAQNVAALAQLSFVTFLLAPPLLGGVAQAFGIRAAFAVGLPLVLLSLATAGALRARGA